MIDSFRPDQQLIEEAAVLQARGQVLDFCVVESLKEVGGRICRIHNRFATGSGFLISEDLVMSAAHVVNEARTSGAFSEDITFAFVNSATGPEQALVKIRPDELVIVALDVRLDYVVVRLPYKIGLKPYDDASCGIRGWFPIALHGPDEHNLLWRSLLLLQFPSGKKIWPAPLSKKSGRPFFGFSAGEIVDSSRSQIFHNAASEGGSSGGVCLAGRTLIPIALHKGNNGAGQNVATKMSLIVDHIRSINVPLYDELSNVQPERFASRIKNKVFILNRDSIIKKVWLMLEGADRKPFFVSGAPRSGRTFIKDIVELLKPRRLKYVDLAENIENHEQILDRFSYELLKPGRKIQDFDNVEPIEAYFKRAIDDILLSIDSEAGQTGQIVFLYVDNADATTPPCKDLVLLLPEIAHKYVNIRVAISGADAPTPSNSIDLFGLVNPARQDFVNLAESYANYHGLDLKPDTIMDMVDALLEGSDIDQLSCSEHYEFARILCNELRSLADRMKPDGN